MAAAKRKLVFDSPNESSVNFETSPNFPKEWKIDGMDIENRIRNFRDELQAQGLCPVGSAGIDPKSKFRTEYRRIVNANTILTDVLRLQQKEGEWLKNASGLLEYDIQSLHARRDHLDNAVEQLKSQLSRLDSSVAILKSQQMAVKSVLELREDEYLADDADSNLPDEFLKFSKISKLCAASLQSYENVKKRNEEMQKELIAERNRQRKLHDATMKMMEEKERVRVEQLEDLFKDFSLEQLTRLRDRIRQAQK